MSVSHFQPACFATVAMAAWFAGAAFAETKVAALDDQPIRVVVDSNEVFEARQELADAVSYLDELERGEFAEVFVVDDDGSMRCGEPQTNPLCKPLTEADRAAAIAEARELVSNAQQGLAAARNEGGDGDVAAEIPDIVPVSAVK